MTATQRAEQIMSEVQDPRSLYPAALPSRRGSSIRMVEASFPPGLQSSPKQKERWEEGATQSPVREAMQNVRSSLLRLFCWAELGHVAAATCREGWEM